MTVIKGVVMILQLLVITTGLTIMVYVDQTVNIDGNIEIWGYQT